MSEEEIKKFEVESTKEGITWNHKKESKEGVEISINDFGKDLIKKTLTKLNDNNKLTDKHFSVYEKFVGG